MKQVPPEVIERVGKVKDLLDPAILQTLLGASTAEVISLLAESIEGAHEGYSMTKSQLFSTALLLCEISDADQRKAEAEFLKEVFEEYQFFKVKLERLQDIYDSIVQVPSRKRVLDAPLRVISEEGGE